MGYGAPNPVRLIIDTDNTDRCSRTSGRAALFGYAQRQSIPPSKATNTPFVSTRLTVPTYLLPTLYFLRAFHTGFPLLVLPKPKPERRDFSVRPQES